MHFLYPLDSANLELFLLVFAAKKGRFLCSLTVLMTASLHFDLLWHFEISGLPTLIKIPGPALGV